MRRKSTIMGLWLLSAACLTMSGCLDDEPGDARPPLDQGVGGQGGAGGQGAGGGQGGASGPGCR